MAVAVRLFLVVVLLAGETPVCKIAAARSLSHVPVPAAPTEPVRTCKKGCCAARRAPAPAAPARDQKPPTDQRCPTDCLSPLCSPVPILNECPAAVVREAGASERVPVATVTTPADDHPSRLDRPPRA